MCGYMMCERSILIEDIRIALADGIIYQTLNYRPLKALKHVREDTCFSLVNMRNYAAGRQRVRGRL